MENPSTTADDLPAEESPSFDEAFMMLGKALVHHFADNIPAQLHAEEIQIWHINGNHVVAWQHAIQLLEQALDAKLSA